MEGLPAVIAAVGLWMLIDRWRRLTERKELTIVVIAATVYAVMLVAFAMTWGD